MRITKGFPWTVELAKRIFPSGTDECDMKPGLVKSIGYIPLQDTGSKDFRSIWAIGALQRISG